jgi:hypothetical protein
MKPPPKTPEFERFTQALRRIIQVPKAEVQRRMEEAKKNRAEKASGHASRDKD